MKVSADYICEHGMPQPWATCTDCMLLPHDQKPEPPRPEPAPPKPKPAPRQRSASPGTNVARSPKVRAAPRPSTRLPRTIDDDVPPLVGSNDLAYEIPASNLRHHVQGPDNSWLPISSMPKELRNNGWVYLQTDTELVARCQVKGVGFREKRWTHEPAEHTSDAGPGPTLELKGEHWQFVSIELGPDGDAETDGYRYVITQSDGTARVAGTDEASDGSED